MALEVPAAGCGAGWLSNERRPVGGLTAGGSKEERAHRPTKQECPRGPPSTSPGRNLMSVIIGVDPHKATHTAVAIDRTEVELTRAKVRATCNQVPQLLDWAEPLGERTWAVESADGLGYLLSQQLIGAGETVVDVPSTLAARVRVLGTGRSDKNDPNDALSVAIAALRTPGLREVAAADHTAILRLLAKRNVDIGNQRSRVVCRLHSLLMELSPGGIAKELNASDAIGLLDCVQPASAAEANRHDQALELLADIQRLDEQLKTSHKRIRTAVTASNTTLTEVFGIGPILACYLIGFTGDIGRFSNRDRYAAYNGTAPVERSSGGRTVHRVSRLAHGDESCVAVELPSEDA